MRKASEALRPNGWGLIFNQPPTGQHLIQQKFMARAGGDTRKMFSTRDAANVLLDIGLIIREIEIPAWFDVAPCLNPHNAFGRAFIELTLLCAIDRLDSSLVAEVREFIGDISCPTRDGKRIMMQPLGIILFAHEEKYLPTF